MAKRKSPSHRTVKARGSLLRQRRSEKNWSVEQCAEQAGVSAKTVSKAENGIAISPNKLAQIAVALGEDYEDVVIGPDEPPEERIIRFTIEADIGSVDPPAWVKALLALIAAHFPPPPPDVSRGSVIVSLLMHPDDVERACAAYQDGRLATLDVIGLSVPPRPPKQMVRRVVQVQLPYRSLGVVMHIDQLADGLYRISRLGVQVAGANYTFLVPFTTTAFATRYAAQAVAMQDVISGWRNVPFSDDQDLLGDLKALYPWADERFVEAFEAKQTP